MAETELSDKQRIMERIRQNVPVFDRLSDSQYRIRCPFCGDSRKDPRKARLYLKCSDDPTEPILYNCFNDNCSAKGRVDQAFFEKLGIPSDGLDGLEARRYNRLLSAANDKLEIITGEPREDSLQADYLAYRLGPGLTVDDLDKFKIVWDMNAIAQAVDRKSVLNTLPSNRDSISFLSDDRTVMLTRFFADDLKFRWRKIRLRRSESRSFYTVKATLDLLGADKITVNITEGVFDALSVYKNFGTGDNSVYIGCLGGDYRSALDHVVAKGIFGSHVDVNVYADGDIDRKLLKARFKPYRWLFGKIMLLWNTRSHDFGVKPELISPVEMQV